MENEIIVLIVALVIAVFITVFSIFIFPREVAIITSFIIYYLACMLFKVATRNHSSTASKERTPHVSVPKTKFDLSDPKPEKVKQRPEYWVNLALKYKLSRVYPKVIECCRRALKIDSKFKMAWKILGDTYEQMDDHTQANKCFKKYNR